jgi:DNA polymerase (family 10)
MKAEKEQIANALRELGIMLEILGENPFKIRAYENAAKIIENISDDLKELARSGKLTKIEGIGPAISKKIATIVETGRLPKLDEVKSSIPSGLIQMLQIPQLTPRKINLLWKKLGITTVEKLKKACRDNRLAELHGFGAESQREILGYIESEG